MKNPWETISLQDFENHMSLDGVKQLQTLNEIMCDQFNRYSATTAMILGVAGGNGLNHINPKRFKKVYGVDINPDYLKECIRRYPLLQDVFIPIRCDLQNESYIIPQAELMNANLLLEYIGYENFRRVIKRVQPIFVSCVIQVFDELLQIFCRLSLPDFGCRPDLLNKLGFVGNGVGAGARIVAKISVRRALSGKICGRRLDLPPQSIVAISYGLWPSMVS